MKLVGLYLFTTILWMSRCFGADCGSVISESARLLTQQNKSWKIVNIADLPPDDRALWVHDHAGKCPGIAVGKFNGIQKDSYAVALLKKTSSGTYIEELIVLLGTGTSFSRVLLVAPHSVVSPFVVWTIPPGNYTGVEGTGPVEIPHDSFVYEKMEAVATQFFYSKGKFRTLKTAE